MWPAGARVNGLLVVGVGCGKSVTNVASGTGAGVDRVLGKERLEGLSIARKAFALAIAAVRAAEVGSFVPGESEPPEVFEQGFDEFRFTAGLVEIFVSENESSALRTSALLSGPESTGVTEVKVSGR